MSEGRRGTFVGTALYVSPEMLKMNQACPASDIWALGCIIYKMLVGEVPFQGQSDYMTFQLILERKLTFPQDIEIGEEAKDLIDQLLQLNPTSRLGSGPKGSANDYSALKAHPFFKGLVFESLNTQDLPLARKMSNKSDSPSSQTKTEEDNVVYKGELKKKNKFFWQQVRTFILYREGKLSYFKDKVLLRGTIILTPNTKVVKTQKDRFEIVNGERTYYLQETEKFSSDLWIDKIRAQIESLKK